MRGARGVVVIGTAIGALLGSGCVWLDRTPSPVVTHALASPLEAVGDESRIVFHTRRIEQPAGHDYLNRGLWTDSTDPLPHELSQLLAVNQFRVGVISGLVPSDLERLGTSESAVVSAMMRTAREDQPKVVSVNEPTERCVTDAYSTLAVQPKRLDLQSAECQLVVTANIQADGKVRVRCEPQIQYAGIRDRWKPTADGTGFESQFDQPVEPFPTLAWEVSLDRHEILVVGAADDDDDRLGQAFFFTNDSIRRKQRVLLIQVGQVQSTRPDRGSGATAALTR